ncbi:MAG: Cell division protein [Candidatus Roizmanbacteria bacterium GW2011_GWA2_36_23]|uniref:Cell division protein FtsX n=1 Tax=Candidatus Roizmanbacteria bacterium GW2011_GWA2_36_23 TaxID=1618480 RepID=A0A0G0HDH1_9BACT|nr:MAG: Cell division protein [Candidatus Roizmanbacteria bacterium GW2011_GWA2_36_23]
MKEILISIRRAPYQTFAAFLVLFFTLFLSVVFFVSLSFLYGTLGYLETRPQVTVYFQTKIPEKDIFQIRNELISSDKVLSIKYVSKNEAYTIYKNLNKDNPLLLEMVSADILPPSLEIYAKKPLFLPEIAEYLKKQSNVDEVQFQKDIVDQLLTLTGILRKTTIVFFGFLLLMSIVVLTTTTLFKIALKKDEIELLQLIGASGWYIKKPFIMESIFLGFLASTTSFFIIMLVILYLNPFLTSYLKGIQSLTLNIMSFQISVWPLNIKFLAITYAVSSIFGIIIAMAGSFLATQKYLKH